jgi:hypothetical protein
MTPQERQLIDDLFDRLSKLENSPRDPDAQGAIAQGLRTAPNAVYALVQTALVQDEALRRAHERIQELESRAPEQRQPGGFLDSMRDSIFGQDQRQGSQGSVPNVRAPGIGGSDRPVWNSGQVMGQAPQQYGGQQGGYAQPGGYGAQQPPPVPGGGGGGSFLGTAAAAAAGVVGGSLLLGSIRNMMGGGHQQSFGDTAGHSGGVEDRRPWGDRDLPGGDLAKQAGVNDIGSSGGRGGNDYGSRQGLFDQSSNEGYEDESDLDHDSDGFDDDGGDSDYA